MPKVVDHEQRRAEFVAAAWTVIANEGIEAATIRRIAEVAGCTTGRVTHYFDAKDEILVAALRRVHYAAGARMLDHLRTKQGADALRAVLLDALPLDRQRTLEWRVWLAFWGRASTDDTLIEEQQHRYAEWRRLLQAPIAATARKPATSHQVRLLVDLVAGAIDGLGIQAVLEPSRFPAQHLAAAVDALVAIVAHSGNRDSRPGQPSAPATRTLPAAMRRLEHYGLAQGVFTARFALDHADSLAQSALRRKPDKQNWRFCTAQWLNSQPLSTARNRRY